jgi:hypothetical protein
MALPSGASAIQIIPGPKPSILFGQALTPAIDPVTSAHIWDEFISGGIVSGAIGSLGWETEGNAEILLGRDAHTNPGAIELRTGPPSNSGMIYLGGGFIGSETVIPYGLRMTWICRLRPFFVDYTARRRLGLGDNFLNDPPSSGIYFEHLSGETQWRAVVKDAASATEIRVNTGISVDTTWHKLVFAVNASVNQIDFYIDDILRASINYIVAPLLDMVVGAHVFSINAALKSILIDLFEMRFSNLPR